MYSYDAVNWVGNGMSIFSSIGYGVAWNGIRFLAVGEGVTNTIGYSTDGISWIPGGKTVFTVRGRGIAWNNTRWIGTGEGGNAIAEAGDNVTLSAPLTWARFGTSVFTTGLGVASNPRIGPTVVPSQIYLGNTPYPSSDRLEICSDAYYNNGYTDFTMSLTAQFQ